MCCVIRIVLVGSYALERLLHLHLTYRGHPDSLHQYQLDLFYLLAYHWLQPATDLMNQVTLALTVPSSHWH